MDSSIVRRSYSVFLAHYNYAGGIQQAWLAVSRTLQSEAIHYCTMKSALHSTYRKSEVIQNLPTCVACGAIYAEITPTSTDRADYSTLGARTTYTTVTIKGVWGNTYVLAFRCSLARRLLCYD
jgi:hypothetical protein